MVEITIHDDRVHFDVQGWDKLWSFKSQLDIPVSHIVSVRADPESVHRWWNGIRAPGTQIPGVLTAGTFYQSDGAVFFDVHHPDHTIVIELDHENFARLVIEVTNPSAALDLLDGAIASARRAAN